MNLSFKDYILDCNAYLKEAEAFFNVIAKNLGTDVEKFLEYFCIGEKVLALDTLSLLKCLGLIEVKSWKLEAHPIQSISSFRLMIWRKLRNLYSSNVENGIVYKILDYLHKEDQRIIPSVEKLAEDVNRNLIQPPSERKVNPQKMSYWIRHMRDLGAIISIKLERTDYLVEYSSDLIFEILNAQPKKKNTLEQTLKFIESFLPCRTNNLEPSIGVRNVLLSLHCLKQITCSYKADMGVAYEIPNLGRINCIKRGE